MRSPRAYAAVAMLLGLTSCGDHEPVAIPIDAGVSVSRPPEAMAQLEAMHGEVKLVRGGQSALAAAGPLYLGDALETGPSSGATIRLSDGRSVEVGPEARFVLGQDRSGLVLEVSRGLVLSRVPRDAAGPSVSLTISTPFGITRVGKSELSIDVGAHEAKLDVKVGSIEVMSRNGQATTVAAGEQVDLSEQGARKPLMLAPIQVTLTASGSAELKAKGQRKWRQLRHGSAPLSDGDQVRVKEGVSALALGESGTQLLARAGTELTWVHAQQGDGGDDAQVDVTRGALTLRAASHRHTHVTLAGLDLSTDTGGQFDLERKKKGYELAAVTGDVKVKRGGVEQLVRAGQVARVTEQGAPAIDEAARSPVVLPARGGTKIFVSNSIDVTLRWDSAAPDQMVEVATDPSFKDPLVSGLVHEPTLTVTAPRKGTLYWRVANPAGAELAKGNASFGPEPPQKDLARLRNQVADGAEKTTIYYQDKPPGVTFTFTPQAKAARYRVSVFSAEHLDRPVAERMTTTSTVPLEAGALAEGSYVWSVTPLSDKGAALKGGKMNKLDLAYDNSVARLVVFAPKNGDSAGSTVRASGVAPVGAKLSINGKPAPLDDKNRFEASVAPIGHPPLVIFRLSRPSSADALTIRVLRKR